MQHMILPHLTGVFAAALLGGCAVAPYDTSMNSCDQEYMMTNPAGAEYYCGPAYGYPLYEGGFSGFVDIDNFHRHHHDHDHDHDHDFDFHRGHDHDRDFHHGGAMAGRGHGEAHAEGHAEGHGGGHDSSGFGSDFQPSGASGSHGGGPRK
ncbi:hypothetical protein FSO04_25990 [Paraburkholderia madseniana]|uniref:Lipoprotein n=1 Tax=Paraburkholderia madseniana TaxID=2599607 RepID=A0A6N6W8N9_9BURK|nr:hypothetical protein [Paraburkholderia madseniana]KAE8757015.1 hypothetical protein FSO04_25990 [Paraburkholderia madseniana]